MENFIQDVIRYVFFMAALGFGYAVSTIIVLTPAFIRAKRAELKLRAMAAEFKAKNY